MKPRDQLTLTRAVWLFRDATVTRWCVLCAAHPGGRVWLACGDWIPYGPVLIGTDDPGEFACAACRAASVTPAAATESVVVRHPGIKFGQPTVRGTGVPVDIVADLVGAGESIESIARDYGMTPDTVVRAAEWHRGYVDGRRRRGAKR